jgi:hypothetical protein
VYVAEFGEIGIALGHSCQKRQDHITEAMLVVRGTVGRASDERRVLLQTLLCIAVVRRQELHAISDKKAIRKGQESERR